jgi:hypothetical protein
MLSIGLWRWYTNITHSFMHYPSSCLLYKTPHVSGTESSLLNVVFLNKILDCQSFRSEGKHSVRYRFTRHWTLNTERAAGISSPLPSQRTRSVGCFYFCSHPFPPLHHFVKSYPIVTMFPPSFSVKFPTQWGPACSQMFWLALIIGPFSSGSPFSNPCHCLFS